MCTIARLTGSGGVTMHGALDLARFRQFVILRRLRETQELLGNALPQLLGALGTGTALKEFYLML